MTGFFRQDGRLTVEGLCLETIAEHYGTPLFVYSAAAVHSAWNAFCSQVAPAGSAVHFAVKANSSLAILRLIANAGGGADIVSGGEMARALAAGIEPQKIVFSGVGKTMTELEAALAAGIGQINAESAAELEMIAAAAATTGCPARVALRVNPDIHAATHSKIATGGSETKFGIAMADIPALYERLEQHAAAGGLLVPAGLAIHIGSQIFDAASFESAYILLRDLGLDLRQRGYRVPALDLGGGIGVDYKNGKSADLAAIGKMIRQVFDGCDFNLGFEPGRVIIAEAGVLLTRVISIKQAASKRFIITDAAMNDLIRPTLYEAYHRIETVGPAAAAAGPETRETENLPADIVGPVCETGDFLGLDRNLPAVAAGDLLAVLSAGAYGAVMRSSYNTRPPAAEVLVLDGRAELISRRQTVQELLELEMIPQVLR